MAKKKKRKTKAPIKTEAVQAKMHPEVLGASLLSGVFFASVSLLSFVDGDAGKNAFGIIGHMLALFLQWSLGFASFALLPFVAWVGIRKICQRDLPGFRSKVLLLTLFVCSSAMCLNVLAERFPVESADAVGAKAYSRLVQAEDGRVIRYYLGGWPTYYLYKDLPGYPLSRLLNDFGVLFIFGSASLACAFWLLKIPVRLPTFPKAEEGKGLLRTVRVKAGKEPELMEITPDEEIQERPSLSRKRRQEPFFNEEPPLPLEEEVKAPAEPQIKLPKTPPKVKAYVPQADLSGYKLPPPALLTTPKKTDQAQLKKDLRRRAEVLEETLSSFGIEAKVGQINCGPTIASFEVHPSVGVKVQKIKALEHDIALNLEARSIRIIAPIPGKAAVGIEVPNPIPQEVGFQEILTQYLGGSKKFQIPILLGKSVSGDYVMSDMAKMPHCIIAGATGSGKSVCINTIVMSILMTSRPDEIKLLMVDPKKVELTGYSKLPHMIAPVITEPGEACQALNWLVKEMEFRYEVLKQVGYRNITSFNDRKRDLEFEESLQINVPEKMPYILGIIDELADLMMVSSSDIEAPIARIAQMARAVGIHLLLATQRPSREVITGLIKANFPTRVSFKVASRINSQIILDETGAETLLGNGDMRFLPPGSSQLIRAQGAFIRDEDIRKVVNHVTEQSPPNYLIQSFNEMSFSAKVDDDSEPRDALYDQAISLVVQTGNASTTFLQRKLKVGYARAASLMDQMEADGVVGPQEGAKPRQILISSMPGPAEDEDV